MSEALHQDETAIAVAREALAQLHENSSSLLFGTIITDDGFEVANTDDGGEHNNRMAAMVSSMQALSDAIVRDLGMGHTEYTIIAAPKGYVIAMKVPDWAMVLAASFEAFETVGKALSVCRIAARHMATLELVEEFEAGNEDDQPHAGLGDRMAAHS